MLTVKGKESHKVPWDTEMRCTTRVENNYFLMIISDQSDFWKQDAAWIPVWGILKDAWSIILRLGSRQPPPQALRFSHGRGERETRVTGDEPQGTMGRVQTAVEARCLLPASLCARIEERRLGTSQFRETYNTYYGVDFTSYTVIPLDIQLALLSFTSNFIVVATTRSSSRHYAGTL